MLAGSQLPRKATSWKVTICQGTPPHATEAYLQEVAMQNIVEECDDEECCQLQIKLLHGRLPFVRGRHPVTEAYLQEVAKPNIVEECDQEQAETKATFGRLPFVRGRHPMQQKRTFRKLLIGSQREHFPHSSERSARPPRKVQDKVLQQNLYSFHAPLN